MDFLPGSYDVNGATWFYLSLLLITAVYFRFNRIWSLRNLDLVLLVSLAPGLLMIRGAEADGTSATPGYAWLFGVTGLLLVRVLVDGWLTRRPRMEQNLNPPGLGFLCVSAFVFLMMEAFQPGPLPDSAVRTMDRARQLLEREDGSSQQTPGDAKTKDPQPGPAAHILAAPAVEMSRKLNPPDGQAADEENRYRFTDLAARLTAIGAHISVLIALLLIGHWHFSDFRLGLAMATLYMLLPCTSYDVGKVNHVLPAALIAWAVVAFRRPVIAGGLMGLACGTLVFPVFLLPLWLSFYGRRGWLRFGGAVAVVAVLLTGSLALTSADSHSFSRQIIGSIDWSAFGFESANSNGFWNDGNSAYRIPVRALFLIMLVYLVVRPQQKTLEHLLSHSAAIIVAIQFWYPQNGGTFALWYLPLMLMVVFRPHLNELRPPEFLEDKTVARAQPQVSAAKASSTISPSSRLMR